MATLQDILSGNFPAAQRYAEGYAQMPSYLQDPYLGLSTSQVGNVTKGLLSKTQFEKAQEIASKNAETLLGLPKGNTAMERAKAMGFNVDEPLYHGTVSDITALREPKDLYQSFYTTKDPNYASMFATDRASTSRIIKGLEESPNAPEGANVMLLLGKEIKNPYPIYGRGEEGFPALSEKAKDYYMREFINRYHGVPEIKEGQSLNEFMNGLKSNKEYLQGKIDILNKGKLFDFSDNFDVKKKTLELSGFGGVGAGEHKVYLNPQDVRSRFAAFDPAKANEPDLLSATMAFPIGGLLSEPKKKKEK